jgi:hypothetical protein
MPISLSARISPVVLLVSAAMAAGALPAARAAGAPTASAPGVPSALAATAEAADTQTPTDARWLADRGTGMWTSIFATYVRPGELLVMPFVEYYLDDNFEYKPEELGYGLEQDFRGRYRATEGLLFLGYGLSDRLAIELEAAWISARLDKAADDPSSQPARLEESGQGDWQVELNWRALEETATRPEVFAYLEVTPPSHRSAPLIATPDWEYKLGAGLIRGLPWGTVHARAALTYALEDGTTEPGEYAVEWVKRLSPRWRAYAGIEGDQDEVELIGELQWHFSPRAYLRLNNAYGLTSKATDWGPDVGVVFSFRVRE